MLSVALIFIGCHTVGPVSNFMYDRLDHASACQHLCAQTQAIAVVD